MDRRGAPRRMTNGRPDRKSVFSSAALVTLLFGITMSALFFLSTNTKVFSSSGTNSMGFFGGNGGVAMADRAYNQQSLRVFSFYSDGTIAQKLRQDLQASPMVHLTVLNLKEQRDFLQSVNCAGGSALERFQRLVDTSREHLALEVWKYCALYHHGGMYIDAESPLVDTMEHLVERDQDNIAVINDPSYPRSIHGSLLMLGQAHSEIAEQMIKVLTSTSMEELDSSPLLLPRTLYDLIAKDASVNALNAGPVGGSWFLLQHQCNIDTLQRAHVSNGVSPYVVNSYRVVQNCPKPNGFCCSVADTVDHVATLMTRHSLLPYQVLPHASKLPKPYNTEAGYYEEEELPFISTIREKINVPPEQPMLTPNFFETLLQNDCLPSDKKCSDCLRDKKGSNCQKCVQVCPCYCKTLCHIPVEEKFVSKELTITPPFYARDPSRLIPRIVHQTWYESIDQENYPNMSRLSESFKQSGWEYKFYTDSEAANFLSTHFPAQVREAYDALRPGAFKADLFRYCVLLIYGGVYADADIILESNLDLAVGPDVGFMVPQDEPGTPVNRRMCLWNGFIAAAPGHPFLAKVIETVVNNVRNRFTSVDVDNMFCPDPELSILHAFDTLFTAGPCILGSMVNKVLGRHGQTPFEAGELDPWEASRQADTEKGSEFVIGVDDAPMLRIPGRTIILHQNKWDMGAHRFTLLEKNLVVAATDLPDADDRENQEKPPEHYSKTHVKAGIYGLDRLYTDNQRANEELRFYIDAQGRRQQQQQIL